MRKWIVITAVIVLLAGAWAWRQSRPLALATVRPTFGAVREFITEDSKTRLADEYILTMPIAGRVGRIALEEGDGVTSGQVLARIDDFDLRKQLEGRRAHVQSLRAQIAGVDAQKPKPEDIEASSLKVQEAQLQLEAGRKAIEIARLRLADAERELKRSENLLKAGVLQRAQYDAARLARDTLAEQLANAGIEQSARARTLDIARVNLKRLRESIDDNEYQRDLYQAQIRQTESEIAVVQDQLAKTLVRSPIDGVVLIKHVEDEQVLAAGAPLLTLGNATGIEIEADILSEEIGRVRVGQPVEVTGKTLQGRTVMGRVGRIYPTGFMKVSALGIEQQRVKVIIQFDNSALRLIPRLSVDVRIIVSARENVLTLPEQAVFKQDDAWAVLVIENDRLASRPVEIGLRNDRVVEIVKGITPEDIVVAEPTNDLRAGQRAEPAKG